MTGSFFTRSLHNPILAPTERWWEARSVFNPGVALLGDRIAILYRAVGVDGVSRLGLAWSKDGENIAERVQLPVYEGALDDPYARLGVEDPRITEIDDSYYITYCKASVSPASTPPLSWEPAPFRVRSGVAFTRDFRATEEIATILPDQNTKDAVLLPARIDGRFATLIRLYPSICYSTSADLITWTPPRLVMEPVPGGWEAERVGAGPPPVLTPWGWLLLYHGNRYLHFPENKRWYSMGLAVLDRAEPWKVLYRHPEPIFAPEVDYEVRGPVGNVVFGTGLVALGDRWYLYYGAGDGVIGVAW
ncbi:MAG: glycoside hydrolase family 130 protein, partial [Chloroflexota bacterium]